MVSSEKSLSTAEDTYVGFDLSCGFCADGMVHLAKTVGKKTAVMMITYHHITLSLVSNHFLFSIFSTRIVSAMFQPCFMWPHALFAINGFNGSQVPRNTSCKRCGSLMRSGPGWIKMPGGTCWILCNLPQFLAVSKIFEVNNTMIIIVMQL